MPIVGATNTSTGAIGVTTYLTTVDATGETVTNRIYTTYNATLYSHSTVFVTTEQDTTTLENRFLPALTKVYTPSSECAERWMLAGSQTITRNVGAEITPITVAPDVISNGDFVRQNLTVFSMSLNGSATDRLYRTCQPYGLAATYSPGICPSGQTIAEITAYQVSASEGYRTFWQASCCRSGMTFGPEYPEACLSTFSTPIQAQALVTSTPNGALPSTVYEFESSTYVASLSTYSTYTNSSTTTVATGLAIADPIVVAWQTEDYRFFPSEYAASLAERFDIALPTNATSQTPVPGLSTGAKGGIGVGAAIGACAVLVGVALLFLRRRRKPKPSGEPTLPEMADGDHDLARKKWWAGGKWRSEVETQTEQQELDSKTVRVVPGPPVELDGAELQHPDDAGRPALR